MANTKFQIKRTSVTGRLPNTSDPANTSYIDAGELAVNLTDEKVFSSNGTVVFEVGANLSTISVSGNATINAIIANGSIGTNNQVLVSNGNGVYWSSVAGGGDILTNVDWYAANSTLTVTTTATAISQTFNYANSSTPGLTQLLDSISNTAANIAASANSVKVAYDAAGNAYSNATSFAANADNITSGTLNTDRLPSTANISTAINVGANVNLTADRINVGNSTINSFFTATGIETSGILVVANVATFSNGVSLSNTLISNVATPLSTGDAANKAYVDDVAKGLQTRTGVRVLVDFNLDATYNNLPANATLTSANTDPFPTVDGVDTTLLNVANTRILVTAQSNAAHNGLYVLDVPGGSSVSWVLRRCRECDEDIEVPGSFVFVKDGTTYSSTGWVAVVADPSSFTIGTDDINWTQFSGSGTFTAGDFLYLNGNQFNVNASSNNISSVVVSRDVNGSFSANVILLTSANASSFTTSGITVNTSVVAVGSNVVLSASELNIGNSTVNSALSSTSLDLSGNKIRSLSYTSSNTDLQTFDSFAVSTFRSAQYNVQLTSGTDYYVINLSLVHDGSTVYLSQYGEIFDNVALGSFDATIASSNVNVQFTPVNAVTTLKSIVTLIST